MTFHIFVTIFFKLGICFMVGKILTYSEFATIQYGEGAVGVQESGADSPEVWLVHST